MIKQESIAITPELLQLIAEIDEFKGTWKLLKAISPERLLALKHVATIESIGSSTRIEGANLSDREIEALLSNISITSFKSRDEEEVAGYALVCNEIVDSFKEINFNNNTIKQLHAWLLKYSGKDERHRGDYKKLSNRVEAFDANGKSIGVIFETASPFETPFKMDELVAWTNHSLETKSLHPLLVIGIFVVTFLAIHPFQDGNGRLSRLLTTLLLLKSGYLYVPYSSLENIIENNKEGYYLALRRTQKTMPTETPDWTPWLTFFLRALQKQKDALQEKVEREETLKTVRLPELATNIIRLVQEHNSLSIVELTALTGANRNTLKKHLADLVHGGYLAQKGQARATRYTLP